ncbi:Transportin-3 [Aphelenchoides bicaudatus]|nr:Transportin-3 [Aphelenchoides bicaudatus]
MMHDINSVYNALNSLNSANKAECENASKFLSDFQSMECAWIIADQILKEARSASVCIFAAQTLRRKMIRDFRQLKPESLVQLRESLTHHLSSVEQTLGKDYQPVATQLCVALADLYLQVPEWNNFVAELLSKFAELAQKDSKYSHVLLELLKVFPEELQNRSLRIGDNRRNTVQQELAAQTEHVLAFLEYICHDNSISVQSKAISTFGSWLSNKQCPSEVIAKSNFLHSVILALQASDCPGDVHFAAASSISQALNFCTDLNACKSLAITLKDGVINSLNGFESAANNEDMNKLTSYGRVYADLCTMLLEPIVNTPGEELGDLSALELLLRAADYHDYSIAEHSFDVWYQLSESLYYLDEYEFEAKRETFKILIQKYIIILYKHCRFDPDTERLPPDTDEFMEFRAQACESIKDVSFVLGTLDLVEKMVEVVMTSNRSWDAIESGLFIIRSAANSIVNSDETITPKLLEIVLSIPSTSNSIILTTGVELIGELYDWLSERPDQIALSVNWLLSVPLTAEILKPWAISLQKLTSKGYIHLRDYFERIHEVLEKIESCQSSVADLEEAAQEILKALTNLVNDRPAPEISLLLGVLLKKPLESLEKLLITRQQSEFYADISLYAPMLRTIINWTQAMEKKTCISHRVTPKILLLGWTVLLASIEFSKPWQDQLAYQHGFNNGAAELPAAWYDHSVRVWHALSATFEQFKSTLRVMEHCCRTTRFVIRSMGTQSIVFIEELTLKLVNIYSEYPHSCILYLCSIIVDEYGSNPSLENGLITMLNILSKRAFTIFTDPKNGPRHHPETVDDLFRLAVRFCYRMPAAFFGQEIAENFIRAAIHTVELDHPDANKSVVQFLTEVLSIGRRTLNYGTVNEVVKKHIVNHGGELLYQCLQACIFTLSANLRYDVSNIIKFLVQLDQSHSYGWLDAAISRLPKDSGLSATTDQLLKFKQKLSQCSRTGDYCHEVTELTRLYT